MLPGTRIHPVLGPARVGRVLHRGPGRPQGHAATHSQGQSPGARKVVGSGVRGDLHRLRRRDAARVPARQQRQRELAGRRDHAELAARRRAGSCSGSTAGCATRSPPPTRSARSGRTLTRCDRRPSLVLHTINNGCLQKPPTPSSPQACLGQGNMPAGVVEGIDASERLRVRREGRGQGVGRAVRPGRVDRTGAGCRGHGLPEDATAGWRIAPGPEIRLAGQQMLVKPWSSGP